VHTTFLRDTNHLYTRARFLLVLISELLTQAFAALTRFQGVSPKPMKLATSTTQKIMAARQRPQHAGLAQNPNALMILATQDSNTTFHCKLVFFWGGGAQYSASRAVRYFACRPEQGSARRGKAF
jgi:hypothetical protein